MTLTIRPSPFTTTLWQPWHRLSRNPTSTASWGLCRRLSSSSASPGSTAPRCWGGTGSCTKLARRRRQNRSGPNLDQRHSHSKAIVRWVSHDLMDLLSAFKQLTKPTILYVITNVTHMSRDTTAHDVCVCLSADHVCCGVTWLCGGSGGWWLPYQVGSSVRQHSCHHQQKVSTSPCCAPGPQLLPLPHFHSLVGYMYVSFALLTCIKYLLRCSSQIAKLLNLPRPPGEGRDHEEESNTSVVVEKEADSPISVQVTGRR